MHFSYRYDEEASYLYDEEAPRYPTRRGKDIARRFTSAPNSVVDPDIAAKVTLTTGNWAVREALQQFSLAELNAIGQQVARMLQR